MGCTSSKQATDVVESTNRTQPAKSSDVGPSTTSSGLPARSSNTATPAETQVPPRRSLTSSGPPPEGKQLREAEDKPKIIFVIGGPGSGKGTQCAKIVEKYEGGVRHISSGDLLRAEVKKGTELGRQLEETMKSGALVSDDQVIQLLENEISASAWFGLAYLVDGFPRAVPQAEKFEAQIRPADLVLYFECPEEVMKERITERGKSSGRKDDNPDTVKGRLKTFNKQSLPVVDYYAKQDKLRTVSAVPSPDKVFEEVSVALDKFFDGSGRPSQKAEDKEIKQWRSSEVVNMEKRFYGNLQDEVATTSTSVVPADSLPASVNVV